MKIPVIVRHCLNPSVLGQSLLCKPMGEILFWGKTSSCPLPWIGHITLRQLCSVSLFTLSGFNHVVQDSCLLEEGLSLPSWADVGEEEELKTLMFWIGKNIPVVIYCCMHRSGKDYPAVTEEDGIKGQVLFPAQPQTSFRTLTLNSLWLCLLTCLMGIIPPTSEASCATLCWCTWC